MAGKKPGPTCTTRLGREWIDAGTLHRSRSSPSGPLGMALSLVLGAGPREEEDPREKWRRDREKEKALQLEQDEALFGANVDLIAGAPFGKTDAGRRIVEALRGYLGTKNILYGGTLEGSRADWDGTTIRVDDNFRARAVQTLVELVHEGSHVVWRKDHPKPTDKVAAHKDDVADETVARANQLAFYKYLVHTKHLPPDDELERRLHRTGGHSGS